jgi:hypothetical protein
VSSATAEGWRIYPRLSGEAGLPFYYSAVWQQEVSIYQNEADHTRSPEEILTISWTYRGYLEKIFGPFFPSSPAIPGMPRC